MSTSIVTTLTLLGQQIMIYCGTPLFITGMAGGLLLTTVLLSLKTFRQSSCAFYLTIMSIVNVGQLLTGLLTRLMISGFAIDWTETVLFYCKIRLFTTTICAQTSLTCLCLAVVDQYLATCSRPQWQRWSNIKLARILTTCFVIFWILIDIPYITFFNQVYSPTTNKMTCMVTNPTFIAYRIYFVAPVVLGFLPILISSTFGIMAYCNVQSLAYRTVPLVRRELDKQLTNIVLVQIPFLILSILPYTVTNILTSRQEWASDKILWAYIQFSSTISLVLFYVFYSSPFYVCISASERFRRQFLFVIKRPFCLKIAPMNGPPTSQIAPEQ
ncbi:unnamed protein product [Adineta ricciae]|uniref:G-protein coupled receptors family 1 profile domain-containing protein n=1 Tax=Adineta ricciae TaxID=249248 RepID=A0A814AKT7_ADIRI|nr:unnamed protein product [Adineta ricciae]CAF1613992.1 unnamed protein product [Adineta ricciae]